jgi:hypothetical protein
MQRLVVTTHTAPFNTNHPTIAYTACSFLDNFGGENGKCHFQDLDVDGTIILRLMFK